MNIRTHDVTSHSLGMVVYREGRFRNSKIMDRNSRIPSERTRDDYVTTHDGQTTMDLWLVQGENEDPVECSVLGHFEFYGIPIRPAGKSRLAVTFRYNANGIVEVEAMDLDSGQTLAHRMATSNVTLEDLARDRPPMNVVLLMDCSGSMYGQNIQDARKEARSFVEWSLGPNRQLSVVAFPGGVVCPFTADKDRLLYAIENLSTIGSTPMAEGLTQVRAMMKPRVGVLRICVVMTNGHPDDPDAAMNEAHLIRANGGRLITIGIGDQINHEFLKSLASKPDDFYFGTEPIDLSGPLNLVTELTGA